MTIMMGMVTHQQKATLDYIEDYIAEHAGVSPSLREIADYMGVSLGNAWRLLNALTVRGRIRRRTYRARSLEVVTSPPQETYYVWDSTRKALVRWWPPP